MFSYKNMKNKVFVSSSNITDNVKCIDKLLQQGVAGVITKTISPFQDQGIKGKIWISEKNVYNSTGYSSKGWNQWKQILNKYISNKKLVIPSIYAEGLSEILQMGKELQNMGVPAIELGMSCPNVAHREVQSFLDVLEKLKKTLQIPIYVKLCAKEPIEKVMMELCEIGIDGFALSDTFPKAIMQNGKEATAGVSGEYIREAVLQRIRSARKCGVKNEIIGIGGIFTKEHIQEYLEAGADAVGICSCLYIYGMDYITSLLSEREVDV